MTKYQVTIAATSYHHVECHCSNEDEAELEAMKKFQFEGSKPIGITDYEVIEIHGMDS